MPDTAKTATPKPIKPVKYRSDNPFLCQLWAVYGDLPLEQLIEKWKHDNAPQETHTPEKTETTNEFWQKVEGSEHAK